jgi:anti-sigma B factor antagonist
MTDGELLTMRPIDGGVALAGEIDAHTGPRLTAQLTATLSAPLGDGDDLTLDMSEVEFVDSSGLRVLIELHQQRAAAGARLVVQSPSAAVRRLLDVSGVGEYLTVTDTATGEGSD